MRLAYSTNAFTRTSLSEAIDSIAEIGFEGVEILCDKPHWFPGEVTDAEVEAVAAQVERLGLGVSNLNANTANGYYHPRPAENIFEPSMTNPDPELRRWREDYTIEALRLAKRVGASCVSVTSGRPTPGVAPEQQIGWFVDSLKRVCEAAAAHGVKVGIEYEPGLLVEFATELQEVMEKVGSPDLGLNFDIGHSYLCGEVPEEVVRMCSGRIWNVHVEDIKGRKHFHLAPGDGDMPFGRYFETLRHHNYASFLTVELYTYPDQPVEAGRRSLEYLSGLHDTGYGRED